MVDQRIEVKWGGDDEWYSALVLSYVPKGNLHLIRYDVDAVQEQINLSKHQWRLVPAGGGSSKAKTKPTPQKAPVPSCRACGGAVDAAGQGGYCSRCNTRWHDREFCPVCSLLWAEEEGDMLQCGACALWVHQDGQGGRLGEAMTGHHGLLRLHLMAWGCPPHS